MSLKSENVTWYRRSVCLAVNDEGATLHPTDGCYPFGDHFNDLRP